jgi:isopentenyl-diphosphate delta-isomerase
MEYVICVDQDNNEIWVMEKIAAHKGKWTLHRAFSVILSNKKWEILLQQRALNKYHCPWLRANSCCSHPRQWEQTIDAAKRRIQEELGIICDLHEGQSFIYNADCGNNLVEYEYDTIFEWRTEISTIPFNTDEVMDTKWIQIDELKQSMKDHPEQYTPRFHEIAKILRK